MVFNELLNLSTSFDSVAISRYKIYVNHNDEVNNALTDIVVPDKRGSWSTNSTYIITKHSPEADLVKEFRVTAIGIEDEHTLGVILER